MFFSAAELVSSIVGQKRALETDEPTLENEEVKKVKTDPEVVILEDEDDDLEANTEDQAETEG